MLLVVFYVVFSLLLAIGLPMLWQCLQKLLNQQDVIPNRLRIQSPIGLVDVGFMFVVWFASQAGGSVLTARAMGIPLDELSKMNSDQQVSFMLWTSVAQLVATGVALLVIGMRYRAALRIFGWQPENLAADIRLGGLAFLTVIPALLGIQSLLTYLISYDHATLDALSANPSWTTIGVTWLTAVIIAPITEEFYFRGVLQSWLQRIGNSREPLLQPVIGGWLRLDEKAKSTAAPDPFKISNNDTTERANMDSSNPYEPYPVDAEQVEPKPPADNRPLEPYTPKFVMWDSAARWMPIVISAAVFGIAHLGQGPAPITLFLFGLALGYLYRQTGSIVPCILLHMMLNGYSMFWLTLQTFFPDVPAPVQ